MPFNGTKINQIQILNIIALRIMHVRTSDLFSKQSGSHCCEEITKLFAKLESKRRTSQFTPKLSYKGPQMLSKSAFSLAWVSPEHCASQLIALAIAQLCLNTADANQTFPAAASP